jgi:hypothetical protein
MFVYFYYVRELHGLGSGSKGSKCYSRARSPATKMMNFRLGLNVVLPKSSAGAINFIWTTYLGNYHNCSTLYAPILCRHAPQQTEKIRREIQNPQIVQQTISLNAKRSTLA